MVAVAAGSSGRRAAGTSETKNATVGLSDKYVRTSVAELKAMNPDFPVPAHCAGERCYEIARAEMPGRVLRSTVGTPVTFGA